MGQKPKQRTIGMELSRRRFLSNIASGATGAALALAGGKRSWYAYADAAAQSSFMINIHIQGGWDSNWFHMAFPKSMISTAPDNINLIADMPAKQYEPGLPKPGDPGVVAGSDPYGRAVDASPTGGITSFYHNRYTERTLSSLLLSNSAYQMKSGHYLGAGLVNAFAGDTTIFKNRACILKGLRSGGAHVFPNKGIIHGSQSSYAIPYSGLIAEALATRRAKRPLHYIQLTSSPTEYMANWAMTKGDQVPINCSNHDSFKALVTRAADDFTDASAYSRVNESVARLGGAMSANKFSLSQSKTIYTQFVASFQNALTISTLSSKIAAFVTVWLEYAEYARQRLVNLHSRNFITTVSPEVAASLKNLSWNSHDFAPFVAGDSTREGTLLQGAAPASGAMYPGKIDTFTAALETPFTASDASLNIQGGANEAQQLRVLIARTAWKFAIAEYLITQGLSSVVDLTLDSGDRHRDNATDLRLMSVVFSLYARLLSRLSSTPFSGTGTSYLDRTLVTVFSEFDRTAQMTSNSSREFWGSEHGDTTSILFAGYGVKPGVVGDRHYGAETGGLPFMINGAPTSADYNYVFPTIMRIFQVPIPAQQLTDATFIQDVLA